MEKLTKTLGVLVAMSFGATLQPQVHPCGSEPDWYHQCRQNETCVTHRICDGERWSLGTKRKYCCYENAQGLCVEVMGTWECCSTDGGTWKALCEIVKQGAEFICMYGERCEDP